MAELRWNPLLRDWTIVASHRQNRPQMPADWCPFCPPKKQEDNPKVPLEFDVLEYDNDFPALMLDPPEPDEPNDPLYRTAPCAGKCEVILYSPDHNAVLPEIPDAQVEKLVALWCERFEMMRAEEKIKYCFIFENRGELVGVTMPHPHGQIYGYSYIPLKLRAELDSAREHKAETGNCLFCDILARENADGRRIIFENEHFTVFLPFWTDYPYGVNIISKRHAQFITDFSEEERRALALTIKHTVGMLDTLFSRPFPYMMCMHNAPVDGGDYSGDYHFHIEFYPPLRAANKVKYNASSETGAWAPCNPTRPEDTAVELRAAYARFMEGK